MPRLRGWSLTSVGKNKYTAPELWVPCLQGNVYGHPLHEDGTFVTTSSPVGYDPKKRMVVTESGSTYRILGRDVHRDYEARFPGARKRLVRSLPRVEIGGIIGI